MRSKWGWHKNVLRCHSLAGRKANTQVSDLAGRKAASDPGFDCDPQANSASKPGGVVFPQLGFCDLNPGTEATLRHCVILVSI